MAPHEGRSERSVEVMARYLAVAHQTSESDEFVKALHAATADDPEAQVVLVVPATPVQHLLDTWTEGQVERIAEARAIAARDRLESAGVPVIDARVGDARPFEAVVDALNLDDYDEIIVSTFPKGLSRWLHMDVIHRLEQKYRRPITHVVVPRH